MRRLTYLLIAATLTGLTLAACGDSGTGPDPNNEGSEEDNGDETTYTVDISISPSEGGSVTRSADGPYDEGETVELTAEAATDWSFVEWQGDLTGTDNPQQITIDESKEVTAVFEEAKAKFYLAENGVTIKCEDASVGDTGIVDGTEYTKRTAGDITVDNAPTTCTSGITDMSDMFKDETNFNGDISHWDVSSVTNMSEMFRVASSFNQDLNSWDVSNVTNMSYMFSGAENFNRDLSSWNVSAIKYKEDMEGMFKNASSFNQDISDWSVPGICSKPVDFDTGAHEEFEDNTSKQPNWSDTCK